MVKRITFHDWKRAAEYAKQKKREGYAVDICGGWHAKGKAATYIVTVEKTTKIAKMSPYFDTYSLESNRQLVNRMRREGKKPLRSKRTIRRIAKRTLGSHNITGIGVTVTEIRDHARYVDAEIRYAKRKGEKPFPYELAIDPIHQYSNRQNLDASILHEIKHIKERKASHT